MISLKTVWLVILSLAACTANGILILDVLPQVQPITPEVEPLTPVEDLPEPPLEPDKEIPVLVAVKPDEIPSEVDVPEGGYDLTGGVEA